MHNETNADVPQDIAAPSKLKKLVRHAPIVAFYGGAIGLVGASSYLGIRTQLINLETAKLTLEAAKTTAA